MGKGGRRSCVHTCISDSRGSLGVSGVSRFRGYTAFGLSALPPVSVPLSACWPPAAVMVRAVPVGRPVGLASCPLS